MSYTPVSFDTFFTSIWYKIPQVWRDADANNGRPLQILTLTMAQQMYYYFYLKIVNMPELFDPEKCPKEYLPFLASIVGWKLIGSDPVSWREQIKSAPLLYKIKGTEKSIVLAEKLIGYSVFMTELYRDYTGNIVPKEKIFNTFPLSVKIKPWFRKTSVDTETHVFSDSFSDLLPSFAEGSSHIDTFGNLVNPKSFRRTASRTVRLTSTVNYDYVTGSGSLSRLSKLPRINIVLKKDTELDSVGEDGICTDASAQEALSLLLQFKPFHVYINNVLVLYSLSDYLFTSSADGSSPGDSILYRDSLGVVGSVDISSDEEKISYKFPFSYTFTGDSSSSQSVSKNQGNLLVKYARFNFSTLPTRNYITDAKYLTSLGFSLKGYSRIPVLDPLSSNFTLFSDVLDTSSSVFASFGFNSAHTSQLKHILPLAIKNEIADFVSISNLTPIITGNELTDSVSIDYITSDSTGSISQSYSNNCLWSLDGLTKILTAFPSLINISSGDSLATGSALLNQLYADDFILVASYNSNNFLLTKADFKIDYKKHIIVFNTLNILNSINSYFSLTITPSSLLSALHIHMIYVEKEPLPECFNIDNITRETNVSSTRKHKKFTRYTFTDTTTSEVLRNTQYLQDSFTLSSSGTLDSAITRGYRTQLPVLFSRKTLLEEERNNTPTLQVNNKQPRNEDLWNVLKPSSSSFLGSFPVVTDYFTNFFNVPFYSSPSDTISYSDIDMSPEAQLQNRVSTRWKSILNNVSTQAKEYFLITRNEDITRTSRWTRGSALKSSPPYMGASRALIQPFRNDITEFNRTDNLKDYAASSVSNYNSLGNYRYSTSADIDVTVPYFSVDSITTSVVPTTSAFIASVSDTAKTLISSTGSISYPSQSSNSQYDSSFSSLDRNRYYAVNENLTPIFSMYAGNIRFDADPASLCTNVFDSVDINISGLQQQHINISGDTLISSRAVSLPYNLYVIWREVNTGHTVNIGLVPEDASYLQCRPNIKLLHNGVELLSGVHWTLEDMPLLLRVDSSLVIESSDSFSLIYETLGTPITDPNIQPSWPGITGLTSYTKSIDIFNVDYNYLTVLEFSHPPVIQWWTLDHIACGWSEVTDNSVNILIPEPYVNAEIAIPDVTVTIINGESSTTLEYNTDWIFRALPDDSISYRVQLLQHINDQLISGQTTIHLSYKHR